MNIELLAHSSFKITFKKVVIVTDPYGKGFLGLMALLFWMFYNVKKVYADIALISHAHWDHDNLRDLKGHPEKVIKSGVRKGIRFEGVITRHGMPWINRIKNTVFCFEVNGVKLFYLGDIGYPFSKKQLKQIRKVDIVFIPVGGFMTIGPEAAVKICQQLHPKVIIPMHYRNGKCKFPLFKTVTDFTKIFPGEHVIVNIKEGESFSKKDIPNKDVPYIVVFH